jgi:hypothetical protein
MAAARGQAVNALTEAGERLGEQLRLATAIADEAARSDIESFSAPASRPVNQPGRGRWWNVAPREGQDAYEAACIVRAVQYLSLRGRLEVSATDPQVVRVDVRTGVRGTDATTEPATLETTDGSVLDLRTLWPGPWNHADPT